MADNLNVFGEVYSSAAGIKAYDSSGTLLSFVRPQGSSTYTENGIYNVTMLSQAVVSVPDTSPVYQNKSIAFIPAETIQTSSVTFDSGYTALSVVSVTVNPISSTYVGTGVTQRSAANLTASGSVITAPGGYYSSAVSKAVTAGSAFTPAVTITATPAIGVNETGLVTATASASSSVTPTVTAGYIAAGTAGTVSVSGISTYQLPTLSATTYTPSTSAQTITYGQYLTGNQTIEAIPSSYVVPSGTLSITSNGTYNVETFASVNVAFPLALGVSF